MVWPRKFPFPLHACIWHWGLCCVVYLHLHRDTPKQKTTHRTGPGRTVCTHCTGPSRLVSCYAVGGRGREDQGPLGPLGPLGPVPPKLRKFTTGTSKNPLSTPPSRWIRLQGDWSKEGEKMGQTGLLGGAMLSYGIASAVLAPRNHPKPSYSRQQVETAEPEASR